MKSLVFRVNALETGVKMNGTVLMINLHMTQKLQKDSTILKFDSAKVCLHVVTKHKQM